MADGALGVNPAVFSKLFSDQGVKTTTLYYMPDRIDGFVKSAKTAILMHWNDSFQDGAHHINVTWNSKMGQFVAYNAYEEYFDSVKGYLEENSYSFLSLTLIY